MMFPVACDGKNPPPSQKEQADIREQSSARLKEKILHVSQEFQEAYKADASWKDAFTRRPVWTIDVQARLTSGGPIVGTGYIEDVQHEDGRNLVHFKRGMLDDVSTNFGLGDISVEFKLRCDTFKDDRPESERKADQVRRDHDGGWHDTHVFVARIHSVERAYKLVATEGSIKPYAPRRFTATGECVAVRYVGE